MGVYKEYDDEVRGLLLYQEAAFDIFIIELLMFPPMTYIKSVDKLRMDKSSFILSPTSGFLSLLDCSFVSIFTFLSCF